MAIASMLPVVGTSLVWIPGALFLFANGDTNSAVGLLIWSAVIVGNIDNILRPMLVGNDTEMPDLLVLISTFGGLAMFGGSGLILGPVIAAVSFTMMQIVYEMQQAPRAMQQLSRSVSRSSVPHQLATIRFRQSKLKHLLTRLNTQVLGFWTSV